MMMMEQSRRPLLPCLVVFVLAAAASAPCLAQTPPPPPPPKPIHHLQFDLRTKTYDDLRIELIRLLRASSTPAYNPPNVMQSYVLGPQRLDFYDEPPAWIYIHVVVGDTPQDKVTLAIAIDDLYLMGFSNGMDHWYKFSAGRSRSFKGLPEATVLPIEYNYRDLIDGGHVNLNKVPTSQLQDGLVRFVLMMCEAMRFREIRATFSGNNWEKDTFITQIQADSVVDWGSLSKLIIRWQLTRSQPRGPKWGAPGGLYKELADKVSRNSKVNGPADALKILDFLIRPKDRIPTN